MKFDITFTIVTLALHSLLLCVIEQSSGHAGDMLLFLSYIFQNGGFYMNKLGTVVAYAPKGAHGGKRVKESEQKLPISK